MNPTWQQFLQDNGASIEGESPQWPQHALQHDLFDLSDYGILEAKGADTVTFFQGQLTNNFKLITPELGQFSSSCSPKGRMLASFRILQRGESYFLILPKALLPAMLKRLRMYILMSKVTLNEVTLQYVLSAVAGTDMLASLASISKVPDDLYGCHTADDTSVLRVEQNRALILASVEGSIALWAHLLGSGHPGNSLDWRRTEIYAGIPTVVSETVEAFVPQMANVQLINGVSFQKGCYTGQEVVARMHYLGKLKKRMYLAEVSAEETLKPGDKLYVDGNEQSIGEIVDIQPIDQNQSALLAVLQIASVEQPIHCGHGQGSMLTLKPLPYAFAE